VVLQQILHLHYLFPDLQAKIENYLSSHLDICLASKKFSYACIERSESREQSQSFCSTFCIGAKKYFR